MILNRPKEFHVFGWSSWQSDNIQVTAHMSTFLADSAWILTRYCLKFVCCNIFFWDEFIWRCQHVSLMEHALQYNVSIVAVSVQFYCHRLHDRWTGRQTDGRTCICLTICRSTNSRFQFIAIIFTPFGWHYKSLYHNAITRARKAHSRGTILRAIKIQLCLCWNVRRLALFPN